MIIIPARIGSSRFPNKVMADIMGTPMVIRTAQAVSSVDRVVVATDSDDIVELAKKYGIEAVLTSSLHTSGTERIYEASLTVGAKDDDIIINVQADEPFLEEELVKKVRDLTVHNSKNEEIVACSAYKIIEGPEADDPNIVKVVTDESDMALFFSRAKIPYPRDHHFNRYKGHLGIYGFTGRSLKLYCELESCELEHIEKLEQLRILSHGYQIAMTEVETESFGIDTPEDLQRALKKHML